MLGGHARERRLAGARRPVEDHRVRAAGLDRRAQRRALAEQVLLADEVVERARAHARGERPVRRPRRGPGLLLGRVEQALHDASMVRPPVRVPLPTVLREWGRLGLIGFGGPPAHVALLRELCVERRRLARRRGSSRTPTRRASCCPDRRRRSSRSTAPGAWRARSAPWSAGSRSSCPACAMIVVARGGRAVGVAAAPGCAASAPARAPRSWPWWLPAGVGPGARVAGRARPRRARAGDRSTSAAGAAAAIVAGPWVVARPARRRAAGARVAPAGVGAAVHAWPALLVLGATGAAALPALAWTAFKVGALSYGGGFVIIPLMQGDAVDAQRLDDRSGVRERRRLRPAHAGPGHPDRRRGRLRGRRSRRRAARRGRRLRAVVPRHRARRRGLRAPARERRRPARSSTVPGPPRSARSSAPRSRSPRASRSRGRSACWPPPPCSCSPGAPRSRCLAGAAAAGAVAALAGAPLN